MYTSTSNLYFTVCENWPALGNNDNEIMVNDADPRKYLGSAHHARTEPMDSKYACVEVVVTWYLFKMLN